MTNQKFIAVALTFLCFGLASGQDKETDCADCHQLDGMGNVIGAKLMGIGKSVARPFSKTSSIPIAT